jgi:hypothetical protein
MARVSSRQVNVRLTRVLLASLLMAFGAVASKAQSAAEPGSDLTIYLMTFGVGEEIWEKFGHNAILIHDARTGTDSVYHWGLFDFRQPNFIGRFLKGRMLYSMGGFSLDQTMSDYYRLDRSVWVQQLDLTPAQRWKIRQFISWNEQPQNRDYLYNYFTDNCSTRVRDILDRTLDGKISQGATRVLTGHTYRWHAVRLTQDDPAIATGIDVGLGRPSDEELTSWEEMFLPSAVHDWVQHMRLQAPDGTRYPLVKAERELYRSSQFSAPDAPPDWTLPYMAIGIVVGALILWLGLTTLRGGARRRGFAIGAGVVMALYAVVVGLTGVLLTLLWTVTNHDFAHRNENLFLYNPLWLVLAFAGPFAVARGRATWARALAFLLIASALIGLLLHVAGLSRQANLPMFALALPPAFAFGWVLYRAGLNTSSVEAADPGPVPVMAGVAADSASGSSADASRSAPRR